MTPSMACREPEYLYCLAAYPEGEAGLPFEAQAILCGPAAAAIWHPVDYSFEWMSRYRCPANAVSDLLGLAPADQVKYFRRIIRHGGRPLACEMSWRPDSACKKPLDLTLEAPAIRCVLDGFLVDQCVRYRAMSHKHSQQLEIPQDTMVICLESLVCSRDGNVPLQLSRLFIAPSRGYVTAVSPRQPPRRASEPPGLSFYDPC